MQRKNFCYASEAQTTSQAVRHVCSCTWPGKPMFGHFHRIWSTRNWCVRVIPILEMVPRRPAGECGMVGTASHLLGQERQQGPANTRLESRSLLVSCESVWHCKGCALTVERRKDPDSIWPFDPSRVWHVVAWSLCHARGTCSAIGKRSAEVCLRAFTCVRHTYQACAQCMGVFPAHMKVLQPRAVDRLQLLRCANITIATCSDIQTGS